MVLMGLLYSCVAGEKLSKSPSLSFLLPSACELQFIAQRGDRKIIAEWSIEQSCV